MSKILKQLRWDDWDYHKSSDPHMLLRNIDIDRKRMTGSWERYDEFHEFWLDLKILAQWANSEGTP